MKRASIKLIHAGGVMAERSKKSTGGANFKFARRARAPALRHDVPRTYGGAVWRRAC